MQYILWVTRDKVEETPPKGDRDKKTQTMATRCRCRKRKLNHAAIVNEDVTIIVLVFTHER